jgi:exodeoxyribonuclease VII large subunit
MTTEDLFSAPQSAPAKNAGTNVPEMSVSELAHSLKRTLEETYGRIRVRGELTGLKLASSGHLYGDIKDVDAVVNIVCWKTTMPRLQVRPEDGLEVIITGKVSSYPKSSRYQIIIESMELAGEGALLKMLEERRKKLAAEGLFDEGRKKELPYLPTVIGVVTSPTGAVIRDIIHRIEERFPRRILLWPVAVQGAGAAEQIAAAIRGFDTLEGANRPDVLIVARGGGSLEDLMAFNEEIVVRAAAECSIPLISAVGHETDTTLIDFAADVRAPTPTGAAEIAVPRRDQLHALVLDDHKRLVGGLSRTLRDLRNVLGAVAAKLANPQQLLDVKTQTLDYLTGRLGHSFEKGLTARHNRVTTLGASLRHPRDLLSRLQDRLALRAEALARQPVRIIDPLQQKVRHAGQLLESYSFERVLDRGFAVIRGPDGKPITRAAAATEGLDVAIEFAGKEKVGATLGKRLKP